jgi:hypothetical protein
VILLFLLSVFLESADAENYLDQISRAKNIDVSKNGLQVKHLELGAMALGKNHFSLELVNARTTQANLTLEWIAKAGLSEGEDRHLWEFELKPGENKKIEGDYTFSSLSPFAKIFVNIWEGKIKGDPFFRERFHIGVENPALAYDLSKFGNVSGRHLNLYFLPGTLAASKSREILVEREAGLAKIEEMIGMRFDGTIALILYPDMATKTADTLHTGEGWAFDRMMVEIYNKDTQLDPFHEMTHIVTGTLGSPPPLFDEGLAIYVAETLGSDALEYIVGPGHKIDEVLKGYKQQGKLIPLVELLAVANIGDTPERAEIEYPEAASFVEYLIEAFGLETFRKIFSTLEAGDAPDKNRESLENITAKTFVELETQWLSQL